MTIFGAQILAASFAKPGQGDEAGLAAPHLIFSVMVYFGHRGPRVYFALFSAFSRCSQNIIYIYEYFFGFKDRQEKLAAKVLSNIKYNNF